MTKKRIKKNSKQFFSLHNGNYRQDVFYFFNYETEEIPKKFKTEYRKLGYKFDINFEDGVFDSPVKPVAGRVYQHDANPVLIVHFPDTDWMLSQLFSIIAHENIHVASFILSQKGVPLTCERSRTDPEPREISEAVTYLCDFLNFNVASFCLEKKLYGKIA